MPRGEKNTHPSYGKINVSRYQGDSYFFASDVKHHGGISLTIDTASLEREISKNWVHNTKHIIEVRMSALQFAELITTGMNAGGSPCTITYRDGKPVEPPPRSDDVSAHEAEFNECAERTVADARTALRIIDGMLDDGRMTKTELRKLRKHLDTSLMYLAGNLKFYAESFDKHIMKGLAEAKASVENFVEGKLRALGVKSLNDITIEQNKEINES